MQTVKLTNDYRILKKRSGRYAVQSNKSVWICGEDKVQILQKEGLIKLSPPKKQAEEPAAAEKTEASAAEASASEPSSEGST